MQSNQNTSTFNTFRRLWPLIKPFKIGLFVASIALICNAASDTYMISLLKPLLDKGFGESDSAILKTLALLVLGLMILRGLSGFLSNYSLAWVSGHVVMTLRRNLFEHMMAMPVKFFDTQSTGSLISRITYDSDQVAAASSNALITVVREGAYIIGLFSMMFYYSWQLSLILVLIAPIVSLVITLVSKRFRRISHNMQRTMGNVTTRAEQMLKGHKEVLIYNGQQIERERFETVSNQMRLQNMKLVASSAISDPVIQFIASIALVAVLFIASYPSIKESLSAGTITVVFSSMMALLRPLKSLTSVNAQFQRGMAACQSLFQLIDLPIEENNGTKIVERVKGKVEFREVMFYYSNNTLPILKNINFTIEPGQTVALVGRSGSGKSTIANLLPRFYDIESGSILIDDNDIYSYQLASLRDQIGFVSQQIHLFNDTIANNITYGYNKSYTREDVIRVAEMAHAMDFIEKFENGLDTMVGENGVLLSGGQRQRIAIARALLRNHPILILDEATSALDTESERIIQKALNKLQKNRTALVIAHRLSTIENANMILVIEEGEIVEQGTHNELLAKKGIYSQLHKIQFGQLP